MSIAPITLKSVTDEKFHNMKFMFLGFTDPTRYRVNLLRLRRAAMLAYNEAASAHRLMAEEDKAHVLSYKGFISKEAKRPNLQLDVGTRKDACGDDIDYHIIHFADGSDTWTLELKWNKGTFQAGILHDCKYWPNMDI